MVRARSLVVGVVLHTPSFAASGCSLLHHLSNRVRSAHTCHPCLSGCTRRFCPIETTLSKCAKGVRLGLRLCDTIGTTRPLISSTLLVAPIPHVCTPMTLALCGRAHRARCSWRRLGPTWHLKGCSAGVRSKVVTPSPTQNCCHPRQLHNVSKSVSKTRLH